jgi:heme/copper-type cytochrome/quinol oxidase subunit 2
VIWIAGAGGLLLLVLVIIGLVDLYRHRHTMETWQVVVWALVLIFVPVGGLVVYLVWRISRSDTMQDAQAYQQEQSDGRGPTPRVEL